MNTPRNVPMKTSRLFLIALFLVGAAPLLFAQAGWKPFKDRGYSFAYPTDWNCLDVGGDDYGGTKGYIKALSPMDEANFAMVVMLFPDFSLDLKTSKLSYDDFMKMIFESALGSMDQEGKNIEKTEAVLKHGKVPAYMVISEENEEAFKASLICGDLKNGNAAIIMVTVSLSGENVTKGKDYLDQAEQIMASFTFPE